MGYALTGLIRSARAATAVGNVLIYPMTIIPAAFMLLQIMSKSVQIASRFLPLSHVGRLLRGPQIRLRVLWESRFSSIIEA